MKLIGTLVEPEDLREHFQRQLAESNGLIRRRVSKSKKVTITLVDPNTRATNQAKMKLKGKRTEKKRKGSGQPIRRIKKQATRKTAKKSKAGAGSRRRQTNTKRRKDNFTR